MIGFAIWLARLSFQEKITNGIAWFVVTSDVLWVLGSLAVLISGWLPLSVPGKWMAAGLAEVVGFFAVLQTIGIRKKGCEDFPPSIERLILLKSGLTRI